MFLFLLIFLKRSQIQKVYYLKKKGGDFFLELQGFNLKNKIKIEIKERELHRRSDSDLKNNPRNT